MRAPTHRIDRPFLIVTIILVVVGFFIFSSASLGLLARNGARFSSVAVSQLVFGIGGGTIALLALMQVHYRTYRTFAPYFFLAAVVLTCLVFIPGLGNEINGARRWLLIGSFSVQPAELLKIAAVLCLAWYYSIWYRKLDDIRFALGGLLGVLLLAGVPLLLQPDTGSFAIIVAAGGAISIAAGVRIRHIALLVVGLALALGVIAIARPYVMDRITTFLDPASDPHGAGYQIKQSLIAVGSGGWFGRGFGQSIQKFSYLPEPIGDSIFSVAAEEFGFLGTLTILGLFIFFAVRGLQIAERAPDRFGGLTVVGLVILFVSQAFINIGSMVGIMPLTGEPLTFISHGGTALLLALAGVGIVLNVSRYGTNRHTTP
jgi:cell division protein FtsW